VNVTNFSQGLFVPVIVLGVALCMIAVEVRRAGRKWPEVQGWWWRAILLNAC